MNQTIRRLGQSYHLAGIPTDYPYPLDSTSFDPEPMTKLLQFARSRASGGYLWLDAPPEIEWREVHPGGPPQSVRQ